MDAAHDSSRRPFPIRLKISFGILAAAYAVLFWLLFLAGASSHHGADEGYSANFGQSLVQAGILATTYLIGFGLAVSCLWDDKGFSLKAGICLVGYVAPYLLLLIWNSLFGHSP